MYFVRSGYVYAPFGSMRYMGEVSVRWASTLVPGDEELTYTIGVNGQNIVYGNHDEWLFGLSGLIDIRLELCLGVL